MLFHAVPGSDKLWAADNRMAVLITFSFHNWFFFNPHTSLVYHRAIRQKPNTKRKRFIGGEFLPLKVHSRWPVPSFKVHLGIVSLLKMQRYTLSEDVFCQTPVLDLGLGIDFIFLINNNKNKNKEEQ